MKGRAYDKKVTLLQRCTATLFLAIAAAGAARAESVKDLPLPTSYVSDFAGVIDPDAKAQMEALGYEALGEFGIPERRYFRRNNALGDRTHQVHAFEQG